MTPFLWHKRLVLIRSISVSNIHYFWYSVKFGWIKANQTNKRCYLELKCFLNPERAGFFWGGGSWPKTGSWERFSVERLL